MADLTINNKSISKTNSGFPPYLDFNKLREDSVNYLGELTGKIWTDYNLHDPGITTLEILCYALLDLGYRTNFPAIDIFAKNPDDKSKEDNFFTPAQILGCNPLTITDYRKMLIDIEGVKNAWLEVAEDNKDLCKKDKKKGNEFENQTAPDNTQKNCIDFLNGLYHVYIELDDKKDSSLDRLVYEKQIREKVKTELMAHRNFCEDFVDIYILCKLDLGVCADIELDAEADAEIVYKNLVNYLEEFFSPTPAFYTLQELLDKEMSIEDIFAGRPYNITESHGFVITSELEQIELRKEIHLSDVYQVILKVPGIKSVRRLSLRTCDINKTAEKIGWKFSLPENNIPQLSTACSGFQFSQNGKILQQDFKKLDQYISLSFSSNRKILYRQPSSYLDAEIPKGTYRNEFSKYYSIQNEFPRVYGIAKGGLSEDAPGPRKAQAWQLKAYLLFFDQLLANYLMQLKNIRSLFSWSSPENTKMGHSYFLQEPDSVPDLNKLLRYNDVLNEQGKSTSSGAIIGIPVSKTILLDALNNAVNDNVVDIISKPYNFSSEIERDIAMRQLMEDLYNSNFKAGIIDAGDPCRLFYLLSSSDEIAIISSIFQNDKDLNQALGSLQYLACFKDNYRNYQTPDGQHFSFNIESNLSGYVNFLQRIIENQEDYRARRSDFLNHLLSRFAEQFTDYSLLSFGFLGAEKLEDVSLGYKEKFLSQYDEISRNRGKACDYSVIPWKKENISGFENKVAALAGFNNVGKTSLCNFVVDEFEDRFIISLKIGSRVIFTSPEKFYSKEQAELSAMGLFAALRSDENYEIYPDEHTSHDRLRLRFLNNKYAFFEGPSPEKESMQKISRALRRFFSIRPNSNDIHISQTVFRIIIRDSSGEEVLYSQQHYADFSKAEAQYKNLERQLTRPGLWTITKKSQPPFEKVYLDKNNVNGLRFVNLKAFKSDINNTIVGKPDKFSFELLDHENRFKFQSLSEFDSHEDAERACRKLLIHLSNPGKIKPVFNKIIEKYVLKVTVEDEIITESSTNYNNETEAENAARYISNLVTSHLYSVSIEERDYRWQFEFYLLNDRGEEYLFRSINEFESPEIASYEADLFFQKIQQIVTALSGNQLQLVLKEDNSMNLFCYYAGSMESGDTLDDLQKNVDELLRLKKEIASLASNTDPVAYGQFVDNEFSNRKQKYVYRLVDKDHLHARYIFGDIEKNTADSAMAKKKELFQNMLSYDYIDICLGGDIFHEYTMNGQTWYHYQVKIKNQLFSVEDLVLFESVQGYVSEEEAQNAFAENFLQVFSKAMNPENYGNSNYISFKELQIQLPGSEAETTSIVFIPDKTKEIIGWYNEDHLKNELSKIAKKYPVRFITDSDSDSDEFNKRFPCTSIISIDPCVAPANQYYYYILADKDGNEVWQSIHYYNNPDEARIRFYFFQILLAYPGNYYVHKSLCDCIHSDKDNCECKWEICIREVLAESKQRFESTGDAWKEVEKFICVSQATGSFHTYFNKQLCANTFFVACNPGFIHPCKYHTSKKRDTVVKHLFAAAKKYFGENKPFFISPEHPDLIYDENGNELAKLTKNDKTRNYCQRLFDFVDTIFDGEYEKRDGLYLINKSKEIIAKSVNDNIGLKEWKEQLLRFAYYFPVIKTIDKDQHEKFCIEIRFPGFNHYGNDLADDEPCGCEDKVIEKPDGCYVAWKSACCFDTCTEAFIYFYKELSRFTDYLNYRAVFDCDCKSDWGGYGIELIIEEEIIAYNPQNYLTVDMDCDAVERTKKLINSEGLHVVEHILLRPRCIDDCNDCDYYLEPCANQSDCEFSWKAGDKNDFCNPEREICFVPGQDPYSFIATIALPAWPERFRKNGNRQIIENLLQREAPAHVLLRILWLVPSDLCLFESHFRKWNYWLSWIKQCEDAWSQCDFLKFLFTREFQCLDECESCLPCKDSVTLPVPCFTDECDALTTPGEYDFLNQVNEIYCWKKIKCGQKEETVGMVEPVKQNSKVLLQEPAKELTEVNLAKRRTPASTKQRLRTENKGTSEADTERKIDRRYTNYRENLSKVISSSENNKAAGAALGFLKLHIPGFRKYHEIIELILGSDKLKGRDKSVLSRRQQKELVKNVTFYYFDTLIFNDKEFDAPLELKKLMEKLKKKDLVPAYKDWNAKEVKQVKPAADLKMIHKLGW